MEDIRPVDFDKLHDSVDEIKERLTAHTAKEEEFQKRVEESMEHIANNSEKIATLEIEHKHLKERLETHLDETKGYGELIQKLDQHLEETKEFSNNLKKSLWGAFTVAIGAVLGLIWEWIKAHVLGGK